MNTTSRIIATLITLIATSFFFLLWITMLLESILATHIRLTISLVIAIITSYLIWKGSSSKSFISYILKIGLIVGSIGFSLGFFVPIIMGAFPLLGIFITGPLGFMTGLIGGAIRWRFKKVQITNY